MVFIYGSTLAGLFAAEAAMAGTTLAAEIAFAQTTGDAPAREGRIHPSINSGQVDAPLQESGLVVFDPSEDVRKKFEVDLTVDPSRFGAYSPFASGALSPREETWFAAAGGPTEPRGLFEEEFNRARELFRSGQDEGAFEILHGAVSRAGNPIQARMALIRAHVVLEEVFGEIPLDSTTAFETRIENLALQRRYFVLMRELWRFRARFLLEVLVPDASTPDERNRLGSWGQELNRRARDFHIDLTGDESHQGGQLAANRRHQDRADELTVQESLFVRDFRMAKALLDLLFTQNDEDRPRDYEGLLREYRLYRLGVAIYQSLDDREKAHRLRFRALVFADGLLQSAPDQTIQDFLRAAEELSISDDHENEELDFITDVLFGCLNRIRRGPASHQGVMSPESISRGFFLVATRRIEVLIRQTPLSERRAQIGELQALRADVSRLESSLPRWQGWDDAEFYQAQVDAVLWELTLILVRSKKAAGQPEQAAGTLFAAIISGDLPEDDHRRLYTAYRLLEEMNDAAGWSTKATAARLQAEAHALVLRARGEEVPS